MELTTPAGVDALLARLGEHSDAAKPWQNSAATTGGCRQAAADRGREELPEEVRGSSTEAWPSRQAAEVQSESDGSDASSTSSGWEPSESPAKTRRRRARRRARQRLECRAAILGSLSALAAHDRGEPPGQDDLALSPALLDDYLGPPSALACGAACLWPDSVLPPPAALRPRDATVRPPRDHVRRRCVG